MREGRSSTLRATISPSKAKKTPIAWESSHPDVVSVDGGKVTAIKYDADVASVTITVTTENGLTAKCVVTVTSTGRSNDKSSKDDEASQQGEDEIWQDDTLPLLADECTYIYVGLSYDDPNSKGYNLYYVITADGEYRCYKDDSYQVIDTNVRSICPQSSRFYIKEDNSLWGYGDNSEGQLGDDTGVSKSEPIKIMDDVAIVKVINNRVFAITMDRELWAWGNGVFAPKNIETAVDVSASGRTGYDTVFVLTVGGDLYELDALDDWIGFESNDIFPLENVTNWFHVPWNSELGEFYWVDTKGALRNYSVKYNESFELTRETTMICDEGVVKFNEFGGRDRSIYIIKNDNTYWGYGKNDFGQLGDGTLVPREDNAVKIADGVAFAYNHIYLKTNGELWGWDKQSPTPEKTFDGVAYIDFHEEHISLLFQNGQLRLYNMGKLGSDTRLSFSAKDMVASPPSLELENIKIPRTLSFDDEGGYEVVNR